MVMNMLKNTNYSVSGSQALAENINEVGNTSIDWLLATGTHSSYPEVQSARGISVLKESKPSSTFSLTKGIIQIKDPLWRRVCENILKVLGPDAFADLWKTKLVRISKEGKIAYFVCPTQTIAETIEKYHFVVIGALKEFYPFLTSIETEIKE